MATYDPDRELARKIRDKQISPEDATAQMDALRAGTSTGTPTPTPAAPSNLIGLRDAATQAGLQVGYDNDSKVVSINGTPINTAGLTNYQTAPPTGYQPNTYYGTKGQIDQLLQPYIQPPSPDQNPEIQKALADYQKWAQQPYVSDYAPELEGLVKNILARQFNYDPANDAQFQLASKELTRNVMEAMNARGILNSTVTQNQVQQGVSDLLPQYQQIARQQFMDEGQQLMSQVDMLMGIDETQYGRYQDEGQKLANVLGVVMDMDETQYRRWTDAYERRYQTERDKLSDAQAKVEADRQKVKDAWERVDNMRYADNEAAIALGVEPGTLSKEAKIAKDRREQELADAKTAYSRQLGLINAQYEKERKVAALKEDSMSEAETLGSEEQVSNYYQLRDIYFGGGSGQYAGEPMKAYEWLTTHAKQNIDLIGQKLYNKLVGELTDKMKVQKSYGEKPNFAENPEYAVEYDEAIADPEGWLEVYRANRQLFYDTYTPEGAQILENAAREQLDKMTGDTADAKYQEYYVLAETDPKAFKKKLKDEKATIINEIGIENYEKLKKGMME